MESVVFPLLGALVVGASILWWWQRSRPASDPTQQPLQAARSRRVAYVSDTPLSTDVQPTEAPPEVSSPPAELQDFRLLRFEELDTGTVAAMTQLASERPQPHPLFIRLANGLYEPEQLAEAVSGEPALAAELLRTVNSAAFALSTPISSIQHAISYLGVSYVRGLVAQAALAQNGAARPSTPSQELASIRLWKASQVAGASALVLAQALELERPAVVSTQALLGNLGDIALVAAHADLARLYDTDVSLLQRIRGQQQRHGTHAALVGFQLASNWALPADITTGLRDALLPLAPVAEWEGTEQHALGRVIVCYVAGRIGEAVAYVGLRSVTELDFGDRRLAEYFHLVDHVEAAGLSRLWRVLADQAVQRKINQVMAKTPL